MASDFRSAQHDTAVAVHGLLATLEYLRLLQAGHPMVVAAEATDLRVARDKLMEILKPINVP